MIIRGEQFLQPAVHSTEVVAVEPASPAVSGSVAYDQSGAFLNRADTILQDYDVMASKGDLAVSYHALRDAYETTGREMDNTDKALGTGAVSYERVVTNMLYVWPVRNLGQPSWPNAPY